MRDIAAEQMIEAPPVHRLVLQRPRRREALRERLLRLIRQQQATQPPRRIGQCRGDRVKAVQPYRATGRIGRMLALRAEVVARPVLLALERLALWPLAALVLSLTAALWTTIERRAPA
jgi:hypothetical protein